MAGSWSSDQSRRAGGAAGREPLHCVALCSHISPRIVCRQLYSRPGLLLSPPAGSALQRSSVQMVIVTTDSLILRGGMGPEGELRPQNLVGHIAQRVGLMAGSPMLPATHKDCIPRMHTCSKSFSNVHTINYRLLAPSRQRTILIRLSPPLHCRNTWSLRLFMPSL